MLTIVLTCADAGNFTIAGSRRQRRTSAIASNPGLNPEITNRGDANHTPLCEIPHGSQLTSGRRNLRQKYKPLVFCKI